MHNQPSISSRGSARNFFASSLRKMIVSDPSRRHQQEMRTAEAYTQATKKHNGAERHEG